MKRDLKVQLIEQHNRAYPAPDGYKWEVTDYYDEIKFTLVPAVVEKEPAEG